MDIESYLAFFFVFRASENEDQRLNKEEAESAEIVPGKSLGGFDLPGKGGKKAAFFPEFPTYAFGHFYLCVLCDLCG